MEKVKVSKEMFEALKVMEGYTKKGILTLVEQKVNDFQHKPFQFKILNSLTLEEVLDIYYKGYELEETPEEKLSKHYDVMKKHIVDPFDHGYVAGIESAIRMLGIKIKGINE